MTKVDKQEKISRLGEINEEIFYIQEAEADEKERKAVEDYQGQPKEILHGIVMSASLNLKLTLQILQHLMNIKLMELKARLMH